MSTTPCLTCGDCGSGIPTAPLADPVKAELCIVFCQARKEFCEARAKGLSKPRPSKIAESKLKSPATQARLDQALAKAGKGGAKAVGELRHAVPWNKPVPAAWKRVPMTGERLKRLIAPIRDKVVSEAKVKAAQVAEHKLAKKAATIWMKAIPVVNVISTAYDIYDIASTGYDLYKMIDESMSRYSGSVFEIRPDVSIVNSDDSLSDIYDFKFDGDSFENNPGQKELYEEALGQSKSASQMIIDQDTCSCK